MFDPLGRIVEMRGNLTQGLMVDIDNYTHGEELCVGFANARNMDLDPEDVTKPFCCQMFALQES